MKIALLALVTALLVVAVLTPVVRVLALRLGAVSRPGGRNVNQRSIPRLGGLAICGGFLVTAGVLYLAHPRVAAAFGAIPLRMFGLLGGGAALCAVGVVDDTRGLRALHKLFLQIGVAVFAYACGFRIVSVHLPLLGDLSTVELALPLTVLWIVGIVNAINLIDGLDGLAAGVVFFASTTNFVVAWLSGSPLVALLSAAVAGATLGFLIYNWNPARIFMGDSGSYFLGYVLATLALISDPRKTSTAVSLLVPVLALGVPIFDTLFAMVRRILERRSVFSPDRGHIHHRLLDMGVTHRRAVVILYAVCGIFTFAAIGVSLEHTWQVSVALFAASTALIGLVRFVGYFDRAHGRRRQQARVRPRDAELLRRAIPRLPERFAEATDEADLFERLWSFAAEAELGSIELAVVGLDPDGGSAEQGGSPSAWPRWSASASASASPAALLTASYPLGRDGAERATVRFNWQGDSDDVPPECEILLQVAADLLTQNLARLRSALAPVSEPEERPVSEPPDVLHIPARPSRV